MLTVPPQTNQISEIKLREKEKQPPRLTPNTFVQCVATAAALSKQFGDPGTHLSGVGETFDWMIVVISGKQLSALSVSVSCSLTLHAG